MAENIMRSFRGHIRPRIIIWDWLLNEFLKQQNETLIFVRKQYVKVNMQYIIIQKTHLNITNKNKNTICLHVNKVGRCLWS